MDPIDGAEDPEKQEGQGVSVVAVPTAVFQKVIECLSAQPYRDVGTLLNVLTTYRAQVVRTK